MIKTPFNENGYKIFQKIDENALKIIMSDGILIAGYTNLDFL